MSDPSPSDVTAILVRMTERTHRELAKTLRVTLSWSDALRAATYGEDQGGNRYVDCSNPPCDDCPHPMPKDPTGEAVINPDEVAQLHPTLRKHVRTLVSTIANIEHIMDQASSDPTKHPTLPDSKVDDDRWCSSCRQDRGRLHPVAVHPDGTVRYRGLCRWCHDFIKEYGRRPTPSLIAIHHTPYRRVSEDDVSRALGIKKARAT